VYCRNRDLVETYKILNGFYNINKDLFFDLDDGGHRSHEKKLFKRRFCFDTRIFVSSERVVDNWNSLSAQCVNICTINTFKGDMQRFFLPD